MQGLWVQQYATLWCRLQTFINGGQLFYNVVQRWIKCINVAHLGTLHSFVTTLYNVWQRCITFDNVAQRCITFGNIVTTLHSFDTTTHSFVTTLDNVWQRCDNIAQRWITFGNVEQIPQRCHAQLFVYRLQRYKESCQRCNKAAQRAGMQRSATL